MRKIMSKLPQIDFVSIFSRKKKNTYKNVSPSSAEPDKDKLKKSARKTLKKYKKTFRKLAFE